MPRRITVSPTAVTPDYRTIAANEARSAGLDPDLVARLIDAESGWDPRAVSKKGAIGLMQLMPATAQTLGIDPHDAIANVRGGVKHLKTLVDRYQGDTRRALAAYNAGPGAVDQYGGVPPFAETQQYVTRILRGARTMAQQTNAGTRGVRVVVDPTQVRRLLVDPAEVRPIKATNAREAVVGTAPPGVTVLPLKKPWEMIEAPNGPIAAGTPPPTWRDTVRDLSRKTLPAAGMLVGAAKGAAVGAPAGPPGMFVGGLAGAAIGGMAGEGASMGVETLVGAPPPSVDAAGRRLASTGQSALVAEATGHGVVGAAKAVGRTLLAPAKGKLAAHAEEALKTFTDSAGRTHVLPSEVSTSRVLHVAENVAEGSLLGGGKISAVRQARQQLAEQKVQQVLETLGPRVGPKQAGASVLSAREHAVKAFRGAEQIEWNKFREAAKDLPIATPRLDRFLAELSGREAGAILPNAGATAARSVAQLAPDAEAILIGGSPTAFKTLPVSVQQAILQTEGAMPSRLSAAQFQRTVSDLNKLVRSLGRAAERDPSTYNAQLGLAKKLQSLAQDDLLEVLDQSPKAADAYDAARALSRFGNEKLFNDEVMSVVAKAPEKIVATLLRRDNSTAIEAVRRAVPADSFATVQREALDRVLQPNPQTGEIAWSAVADRLSQLGPDTLSAMFPRGHHDEIARVTRLMLKLGQRSDGTGKLAVQLSQAGSVIGIASGRLTRTAATILLTPAAMMRIFSSQQGLKWLTTGLEAPAGSAAAIKAATQLATFLAQQADDDAPDTAPAASSVRRLIGAPPPRHSSSAIGSASPAPH